MKKVKFTVHSEPRGKERPRFNGKHAYTPKNTRNYEELVRYEYIYQCGTIRFKKALKVEITAWYSIPNYLSKLDKSYMRENRKLPTKKPDCDNIAKAILDALNDLAYDDDKQVTDLLITKRYTTATPHIDVSIEEIECEATE